MKLRIADGKQNIIMMLGIGCVICLLLGFGILLHAQEKTKTDFIGTKSEMVKMKAQPEGQRNSFRQSQSRAAVDFGENAAFYKVIIDNNLFRPLGWTPPNNEPTYSLVGTAVDADGVIAQATLLEKRSNRYHFVTIGEKLGDVTVKDIQAKQVILEKDGKPITLRTETLQFLTTNRGRADKTGEGNQNASEKGGNNNAGSNQANAKQRQMEAEKRRQMEMKEQVEMLGINQKELAAKLRAASPAERQEIRREIRRRAAANRRSGNRGRANRDR